MISQSVPYLGTDTFRWLECLLDRARTLTSLPYSSWETELGFWLLGENPQSYLNSAKMKAALKVLRKHVRDNIRTETDRKLTKKARELRTSLFTGPTFGDKTVTSVQELFADIISQRHVTREHIHLSADTLAFEANWFILSSLISSARSIRVVALGNTRKFIHGARIYGLITSIRGYDSSNGRLHMEISGPLSIFHRTLVYARALQHLVLSLGRMVDFDLRIITEAGSGVKSYRVTPQDPVAWRATEESFDSKLERRLVEDFGKFAPDWDLIREPTSINVDGELFFPDFLLQSRIDRTKSWLMEVVGFWHPDYLRSKLRKLKGAGQPSAILLIDESLNVPMNELSQFQNVLRFKNRIKPVEVLRLIGEA